MLRVHTVGQDRGAVDRGPIALVAGPVVHRGIQVEAAHQGVAMYLGDDRGRRDLRHQIVASHQAVDGVGGIDPEPAVAAVAVRRDLGDQAAEHFHVRPAEAVPVDVGGADL